MAQKKYLVMSCLTIYFLLFLLSCAGLPPRLANNSLHKSIVKGKNETIRKKIPSTTNLDEYDAFGRTALHLSVLQNNKEIVNELISNGADINKITLQGNTPLSLSMRHDDLEIANTLLNYGAGVNIKFGRPALIEAIKFRRTNFCKKLIEKGADVNALDRFRETPLFYAAYLDMPEMIHFLASNGAKINSLTSYGMTPLHAAAFTDNKDAVRELLSNGAKIHPVEDNEKGLYSTAFLYMIIGEMYESTGRTDDAISIYKEASRFFKLGESRFSEGANYHFFKNIKESFAELMSTGLIPMYITASVNANLKNFGAENTDYITSGLSIFKEIHPEYFESKNKQKKSYQDHRDRREEDISESQQLKIDIVNLYKNLSEKFADYSILYSNKARMPSDASSKSSYNRKSSENPIPTLYEIKWIDEEDNLVNLYVYRKPAWCSDMRNVFIFIDGWYHDRLMCNKFFVKKIEPGHHYFISPAYSPPQFGFIRMMQNEEIFIDKNGFNNEDYFVEIVCKNNNPMSIVSKNTASQEMKRMKLNQVKIYQ